MTLKEALDTIAEYCRRHDCGDCPFAKRGFVGDEMYEWCILQTDAPEDWKDIEVME